ncbi:MAG: ACT domain-containing protein [Chloroflexi bacterium]|nr:ACT domain-containing protein [Chloroflexota bacterium]
MAAGVNMSLPVSDNAEQSHIIVIVPDEPGSLAHVTTVLGEAEINIEAIDGRMVERFGVIALSADDDDAALRALLDADLRAITSDVVVFHLPDKPGALAQVARNFAIEDINVRTIHIVHRIGGHAIVAVTTDDDARARSLLGADLLL